MAIGTNKNTRQDNLLVTKFYKSRCFSNRVMDGFGSKGCSNFWNDAKSAVCVAPVLDPKFSPNVGTSRCRQGCNGEGSRG